MCGLVHDFLSAPRPPYAWEAPTTVVFSPFWNLPWSVPPPQPLHVLFPLSENMPLKINFFHSTIYCVVSLWPCALKWVHLGKSVLQESKRGPCSQGTCIPLGKPDIIYIITSWLPNGNWDKSSRRQAHLGLENWQRWTVGNCRYWVIVDLQKPGSLARLNLMSDPEASGGAEQRSTWGQWYLRKIWWHFSAAFQKRLCSRRWGPCR